MLWAWAAGIIGGLVGLVIIHDLLQRRHAILRNFPIIGHFRYLLEAHNQRSYHLLGLRLHLRQLIIHLK